MTKLYDIFLKRSGVNTDTRAIKKRPALLQLNMGENFDWKFVEQVLKKRRNPRDK
jgi:hypothetical protein